MWLTILPTLPTLPTSHRWREQQHEKRGAVGKVFEARGEPISSVCCLLTAARSARVRLVVRTTLARACTTRDMRSLLPSCPALTLTSLNVLVGGPHSGRACWERRARRTTKFFIFRGNWQYGEVGENQGIIIYILVYSDVCV